MPPDKFVSDKFTRSGDRATRDRQAIGQSADRRIARFAASDADHLELVAYPIGVGVFAVANAESRQPILGAK